MLRNWEVAQMGYRAVEMSRNWIVAQMGCRADGISRNWNVAHLKSRANGMSRNWNVAHLKSRANGMSRNWNVAQKNVAQMMWTQRFGRGPSITRVGSQIPRPETETAPDPTPKDQERNLQPTDEHSYCVPMTRRSPGKGQKYVWNQKDLLKEIFFYGKP